MKTATILSLVLVFVIGCEINIDEVYVDEDENMDVIVDCPDMEIIGEPATVYVKTESQLADFEILDCDSEVVAEFHQSTCPLTSDGYYTCSFILPLGYYALGYWNEYGDWVYDGITLTQSITIYYEEA